MASPGARLPLAAWEWRRTRTWTRPERYVFWVAWSVTVTWTVLAVLHISTLNLVAGEDRLFAPLAKRWLTPTPDPYW